MSKERSSSGTDLPREYITLEFDTDDGGVEEVEYAVENFITVDSQEYVVLIPTDDEEAIEFFRYDEVNEEDASITAVEDEAEFQKVIDALRRDGYRINIES